MQKYYPPKYYETKFNCIYCNVYAQQEWRTLLLPIENGSSIGSDFVASCCEYCRKLTYWNKGQMIVPSDSPIQPAHPDLPSDCLDEYDEARSIFNPSPRAAAALLRLVIQKLMPHLDEKGRNINDDIKSLVKKGLPDKVQKALDYCRVVGNNAVHPGLIDINDTPEIAENMFNMINFIVEDRITRPKEIEQLYTKLPEESRKAIEKRDSSP